MKHIIRVFWVVSILFYSELNAQTSKILTLHDCLKKAYTQNSVFISKNNLEVIRQQNRRIMNTALLPDLTLSSNVNQFLQNSTVVYTDNILPPNKVNGARTFGLSVSGNANFNLMNFGRTISQLKALRYSDQADYWRDLEEKNTTIILLCRNYFDCIISQELTSIAKEKVQNSEFILKIAKLKLELGEVDSLEYYQARINFEQDKNSSSSIDQLFQKNRKDLKLFLGMESSEKLHLDSTILANNDVSWLNVSSVYLDTTKKNKVLENENELNQKRVQQKSIHWNLLPDVSIFAGYGYSNQSFQNGIIQQNNALGYSYGINVSYNIGQVKNTLHQKKILKLEENSLSIKLRNQRIHSQNEYDLLVLELNQLGQLNKSKEAIVRLTEKSLENALNSYRVGATTLTELRLIQNQFLNAKIDYSTAQVDYFISCLETMGLSNNLEEILVPNI